MKKFLPLVALFAMPSMMQAQDFTFTHDTTVKYTSGDDVTFVNADNFINNNSGASFTYKWKFINKDITLPTGWSYNGICDNKLCYTMSSVPNPFSGDQIESMPVADKDLSIFEVRMNIPKSADMGTILLHFEIKTDAQTDTCYFLISKTPAGIQNISIQDLSVNVYPNPATQNTIFVATEPSLKIQTLNFYNAMGQLVKQVQTAGADLTSVDLTQLASGTYFMEAINNRQEKIAQKQIVKP